jgi:cell division septal protein FtsQ
VRRAFVAVVLALLLVAGMAAVARSGAFALRRLAVSGPGSAFVTARALGVGARTSLLLLSVPAVAARAVAADPWARAARVRVLLPHTLEIALVPRVPVALVTGGGVVWAVTAAGMVLPATAAERLSLPYVTGVAAPLRAMVEDRGPAMLAALAVARALPAAARPDVSEVHALRGGQAFELVLMDGRPVLLGPATDLGDKLALLPALLARYPWPEYAGTGFDLRDPQRPALYSIGR